MANIIPSKLVVPAIFQNFIEGKNGQPLSNGVIYFYEDQDHFTFKNVYQQTGSYGNYAYAAVNNPLTLSAAGTTVDVNGNDILLYFYPWDETFSSIIQPYFIEVYDQFGTLQFTRSNFPLTSSSSPSPTVTIPTFENYIINNRFWRNIGTLNAGTLSNTWTTQYNTSGNFYYATLAPDQHDGFSMPDINYIKNVNGSATETITFEQFAAEASGQLFVSGDIQPQYYINHTCTADTSGATLKVYQFPISYQASTLATQNFTFTIQGNSVSGNQVISVYIYLFLGTGVTSPSPILIGTITLPTTTNFEKFTINASFPSLVGDSISNAGDSAFYLQIAMPTGSSTGICDLNFTLPSIYLSPENQVPTNSFSTYDQIDTVISSPRTGDIRVSLNSFAPFGWVTANDGSIGSASSGATTRANVDTWPLYNLIWNSVSNTYAPVSGGRGANSYADFIANKTLTLTATLGRLLGSIGTPSSGTNTGTVWALGQTTGNELYTLVADDLPAHTHPAPASGNFVTNEANTSVYSSGTSGTFHNATGENSTTNTALNLQNPVVYYNVFFKL